jgi:hypothetical protein
MSGGERGRCEATPYSKETRYCTCKEKKMMCPYYDEKYKQCNISSVYQNEASIENDCLSDYNWKRCANYERSSIDVKVSKKLRPNPDL